MQLNLDPNIALAEALAAAFAKEIGQQVRQGVNALRNDLGSNFNSAIMAEKVSSFATDMIVDTVRNFDSAKITGIIGGKFNDVANSLMDGLDIADIAGRIGQEVEQALKKGSRGVGNGLRKAIGNVLGEATKGITFEVLPWIVAGSVIVTVVPCFIHYAYYLAKYNIGRPKLATAVKQRTIFTPLTEKVKSTVSWALESDLKPIFNADVSRRITDITHVTNNIRRNGGYFQNILFYGPGGTGKTMISEFIAKDSGMSYVRMSGGDLAQYIKRGEHVTELNKLLDKMNCSWRPWSSRPWILFIDEADSLCQDRSQITTTELLELQNAFLNQTGTQSTRFMIILATNRMEVLDKAILSRMDHKIHIGPPAELERVKIIKAYVPKFFTGSERTSFFRAPQIAKMAKMTEGLTGRALFKLLNDITHKKAATDDQKLTQAMIDLTIKDFVLQEQEVEKQRAQKRGAVIQGASK